MLTFRFSTCGSTLFALGKLHFNQSLIVQLFVMLAVMLLFNIPAFGTMSLYIYSNICVGLNFRDFHFNLQLLRLVLCRVPTQNYFLEL